MKGNRARQRPSGSMKLSQILRELRKETVTVLLSTQEENDNEE